ncbi:hypothetical protein LAZ67_13000368 [Cordylochernes scorpioides]|uniref:Uncharacterized protein n=1 Tax=Cordylochernes scorpioides TaxID=51811 RepID=A0ABY6L2W1_9ARAC|nr:hypothetical protein LAZ67_13000368 [Cordylochernes scorpioides]
MGMLVKGTSKKRTQQQKYLEIKRKQEDIIFLHLPGVGVMGLKKPMLSGEVIYCTAVGLTLNTSQTGYLGRVCLNAKAKTITVLGHEVSGDGIRPDPENIRAIRNFPTPRT